MRFARDISFAQFLARAVVLAFLLLILLVFIASHTVPVSGALRTSVEFAPFLAIAVVIALSLWIDRRHRDDDHDDGTIDLAKLAGRLFLHLAFVVLAIFTWHYANIGNLSLDCPPHSAQCLKLNHYRTADGHYYRQYPYDSSGDDDPGAASVQISRPEYVAETGTLLRNSWVIDLPIIGLAWLLTAGIRRWNDD